MEHNNMSRPSMTPPSLSTLSTPDLYDLYDTSWTAYCAAHASFHNAVRENIPALIEKYQLQVAKLNQTLEEILNEIDRRAHVHNN